jgi:DNA-binding protein HU-beta
MIKSELISAITDETGVAKKDVIAVIDQLSAVITSELQGGGDVTLVGVGKFEATKRSARAGRNPQTGDPITISAAIAPKFKASKTLKEALN